VYSHTENDLTDNDRLAKISSLPSRKFSESLASS
jgi:hypothetical protein